MPDPTTSPPTAPAGLRERGKLDKRRRIVEAARSVFVERGYDAATTREIAQRADVAIGTVFVYARDKRDLLLLIVNDELDAVGARAETLLGRPGPLLDRLLAYFRLRYRYWASEPRLARPALRETFDFFDPDASHGAETQRFYARRSVMFEQVERLVREAQQAGEVAADVAAEQSGLGARQPLPDRGPPLAARRPAEARRRHRPAGRRAGPVHARHPGGAGGEDGDDDGRLREAGSRALPAHRRRDSACTAAAAQAALQRRSGPPARSATGPPSRRPAGIVRVAVPPCRR